ncbi:MAG: LysR family transcriptional regulator [Burkholderiales bacterium]|nr:LysR family transcriptional regulator [Burkholderiales bacterium]
MPADRLPDLQLIAALEALVAEGHVSRAAERMGLSQPAMSTLLGRLRRTFDDPLLLRTSRGMVPTPRALELAAQGGALLEQARMLMQGARAFEPVRAERTFRVIATDYVLSVMLPPLQALLEARAPGIGIDAQPPNPRRVQELLASGQVDLGIGYLIDPPKGLRTRLLFRESSVCIARRGHPAVRGRLGLAQYQAADHVRISPAGTGQYGRMVEAALLDLRIRRSAGLTVPNFLVAPAVVARSNLLATVPARIARTFAASLPLQVLEPPVPLPVLEVSLYWHERAHKDALHRWMRALVIEAAREV